MRTKCGKWSCTVWLVGLATGQWITGCYQTSAGKPDAKATLLPAEIAVRYVAVMQQEIDDRLDLSAKVQADPARMFRVFPPASGRVLGIKVKSGDTVSRGETLATLESADAASALSDLTKAEIEAERALRTADREKVLLDHGAVPEKDYIDARAAADSAQSELARARRHLEVLGLNTNASTDRIPLLSPSHGVVLSVNVAPGEFSKSLDNADPLMIIADLSTVWIVGDVFEKDIAKVQPGTRVNVTVEAFPGQHWTGRIDSVSGTLDPATRTLKVRVALGNPSQKLKPEMFAAIHVDLGSHKAIVVPTSAVIHEGLNTIVFVDNHGKPEQQNVTTGQAVDGKIEIISGIQEGQRVAANGAELLTGGASQP